MKPVIFFSHSTSDRDAILPICKRLLDETGNAVEIFMSSDGASIPLGRNWLKEIEGALERCKLMFVWMTPSSLSSTWIPFESGFAYSRGVRVVPIGFQGVNLGKLPPPISTLQGFNVVNSSSLNNIIAVINDEFSLTFSDPFDDEFYSSHVEDVTSEDSPELLRYIRVIECIFSSATDDNGELRHVQSNWKAILSEIFTELEIPFNEEGNELFGVGFHVRTDSSTTPIQLEVSIDPLALNSTWRAWILARERLYNREFPYLFLFPHFVQGVELPNDQSLIGSRLLKSEVSFDTTRPHLNYRFRNIEFHFAIGNIEFHFTNDEFRSAPRKGLVLLVPRDNEQAIPLTSLFRLLEERHVITVA